MQNLIFLINQKFCVDSKSAVIVGGYIITTKSNYALHGLQVTKKKQSIDFNAAGFVNFWKVQSSCIATVTCTSPDHRIIGWVHFFFHRATSLFAPDCVPSVEGPIHCDDDKKPQFCGELCMRLCVAPQSSNHSLSS